MDRALRLVLIGSRPDEVGQHAVPYEFRDVTLEASELGRQAVST
jgi:hypothetical protein